MSSLSILNLSPAELAVLIERNCSDACRIYLAWRLLPVEHVEDWSIFAARHSGRVISCRPELHSPLSSVCPDEIIVFPDGSVSHETNWSFDIYDSPAKFRRAWDWESVVDDGSAVARFGMLKGWLASPSEEGKNSPVEDEAGRNEDG